MSLLGEIKKLFSGNKAVVLMYHRIADTEVDPWQLSVSRKNFAEHLEIIHETKCLMRVSELVEGLERQTIDRDAICITFDDGYQDNFLHALPLLEKNECCATIFITSGSIGKNKGYWWDILTDIFLVKRRLPTRLELVIGEKSFSYLLDNEGAISEQEWTIHKQWHWPEEPPTQRCRIYLEIWMHLRDLPHVRIETAVAELEQWSGYESDNTSGNFAMSPEELRQLSGNKYIDIGVHTETHAALGKMSVDEQIKEIHRCKDFLDNKLHLRYKPILAYPYGSHNKHSADAARKAGMNAAFTTEAATISKHANLFHLGRYQVVNQDASQFRKMLLNLINN